MWTWTRDILVARPDLTADSITLIDPGIPGYLASGKATFKDGSLVGVPVELLPIGAEQVPSCYTMSFDVVVQINLIEHTYNAFAALHTAFRLLRPGGYFIFSERVVRLLSNSQIYHPVRLTTAFYDSFLSTHFEEVYRWRGPTESMKGKPFIEDEIYFIGRRKSPAAWL